MFDKVMVSAYGAESPLPQVCSKPYTLHPKPYSAPNPAPYVLNPTLPHTCSTRMLPDPSLCVCVVVFASLGLGVGFWMAEAPWGPEREGDRQSERANETWSQVERQVAWVERDRSIDR
jgi:hypothetical protein